MSGKHDRASDLRAIAEGRLMLNVRNGVTVSRSMLAMIADEIDAERAAHAETKARLAEALKALETFARNVELIHPDAQDHDRLCDYGSQFNGTPTVGQARAARRALTGDRDD